MRQIITIVISALLLAAATSCTLESSDNGKLDGFWHLEQVDTLNTGGTLDLSEELYFWAVDTKLLNVRHGGERGYLLRFDQTADSLVLHTPYKDNWHEDAENGGDHPLDNATELALYGINNMREPFHKDRLTGSRMVLRSKTLRLHFRKF